MKAFGELMLYLMLAPLLVVGYVAGLAYLALVSGFRLAAITLEAMEDDRRAWKLRLETRTTDRGGVGGVP